ncbi:MAG: hypothetical protein FWD44_05805 [Oscillospiraceae bacterium]|nr:hypothetical protein [Oscillospiraceae bacterium]
MKKVKIIVSIALTIAVILTIGLSAIASSWSVRNIALNNRGFNLYARAETNSGSRIGYYGIRTFDGHTFIGTQNVRSLAHHFDASVTGPSGTRMVRDVANVDTSWGAWQNSSTVRAFRAQYGINLSYTRDSDILVFP